MPRTRGSRSPLHRTTAPDEYVPDQLHTIVEWPTRSQTLAASAPAVPRAGSGPPRSAQRSHTEPRTPDVDRTLLAQHALRRYPPPQRSQDRNTSSPLLPIPPKQTHTPGQHPAGSQRTQPRNSASLLPAARRHGDWNERSGPLAASSRPMGGQLHRQHTTARSPSRRHRPPGGGTHRCHAGRTSN